MMSRHRALALLFICTCWACDDGTAGAPNAADAADVGPQPDAGPVPRCGDTNIDENEACDDGNTQSGDGCSATCVIERCGDGVKQPREGCDDGNTEDADGCSRSCEPEVCGNRVVDPGETCDDGNTATGDGCNAVCVLERCGNGTLDVGEQCDDGNVVAGDNCNALCRVECGNGALDPGEECDDGDTVDGDGCAADCQSECGNGRVDGVVEECDDGNRVDGDGCTARCLFECGNGALEGAEECDDGNALSGDGCSLDCRFECGDGTVEAGFGEACDDGNRVSGDGCNTACELECGNGALEGAETCDDGGTLGGDGCSETCTLECGDGRQNPNPDIEQCDDGNREPDDGCDRNCQFECGDGEITGDETCDDGNREPDDGCDADCRLECGNGRPDRGEQCELGENGCGPDCQLLNGSPIAVVNQTLQLEGFIDDADPVWNRPGPGCEAAGGQNDAFYEAFRIGNTTGAAQQLAITASWIGDGYIHVYADPFDPGRRDGCIVGDDDFVIRPGDRAIHGSQLLNIDIAAGQFLTIIASTYSARSAIGAYSIEVVTQGVCPDGAVDPTEECDDDNLENGDGCTDQCMITPICGDGLVNVEGEICDDGNIDDGDGCDSACSFELIQREARYGRIDERLPASGVDQIQVLYPERSPVRVVPSTDAEDCPITIRVFLDFDGQRFEIAQLDGCDGADLNMPAGIATFEVENTSEDVIDYRLWLTRGDPGPGSRRATEADPDLFNVVVTAEDVAVEAEDGGMIDSRPVGVAAFGPQCGQRAPTVVWPENVGAPVQRAQVGAYHCDLRMLPEGEFIVRYASEGAPGARYILEKFTDNGVCGDDVLGIGEACEPEDPRSAPGLCVECRTGCAVNFDRDGPLGFIFRDFLWVPEGGRGEIARSRPVEIGSISSLQLPLVTGENARVEFWARVNIDPDDVAFFMVDFDLATASYLTEEDWTRHIYPLTPGQHDLSWAHLWRNSLRLPDPSLMIDDIVIFGAIEGCPSDLEAP